MATERQVRLEKQLHSLQKQIEEEGHDPELVETSLRYAGLLERSYLIQEQIAHEIISDPKASDKDVARARSNIDVYTRRAKEWGEAKRASAAQRANDMIPRIIEALEKQDEHRAALKSLV